MANVIPTKGNLLAVKRSLQLAQLGFELMDRKRNILIHEMMSLIERAGELQSQIDTVFKDAYASLQSANITMGKSLDIAETFPIDNSLTIKSRSIMGVEIPQVRSDNLTPEALYSFADTNSVFDESYVSFMRVKKLITNLAEVETSVYRLAFAIKKTQKRANALKNIIIPGFQRNIKFISDALEEKEREEFVRLKVLKMRETSPQKNNKF